MAFLRSGDRVYLSALRELAYCNPFLPERIELERRVLRDRFSPTGADWNVHAELVGRHPNLRLILRECEALCRRLAGALAGGARPGPDDADLYEHLVLFVLYHRYEDSFESVIRRSSRRPGARLPVPECERFCADAQLLLQFPGLRAIETHELTHLFACFWQMRRAFHHIFRNIIGVSGPAARFRAAVWQSMFTHDMRRYRRVMYDRLADFTTLITGPSGTGKELAARAIGYSRYVPFDLHTRSFAEDSSDSFHAVNLSAFSPTLIESELFGHRRGAFTGAVDDRTGWLESCPALGTVFLDEVGDVEPAIQLKLLRVLETRSFQRIGETKERRFRGKIIAATNRDLAEERRAGRFREDLYYRLCADMIRAPSLRERIADCPDELHQLLHFIARRLVGDEAGRLAEQVQAHIQANVGSDYAWPGNVRELEQCVRNVLVRREYQAGGAPAHGAGSGLAELLSEGTLTAEDVLNRYCALVYARCRNFQETARRLGLDRRTVKRRVEAEARRVCTSASAVWPTESRTDQPPRRHGP